MVSKNFLALKYGYKVWLIDKRQNLHNSQNIDWKVLKSFHKLLKHKLFLTQTSLEEVFTTITEQIIKTIDYV